MTKAYIVADSEEEYKEFVGRVGLNPYAYKYIASMKDAARELPIYRLAKYRGRGALASCLLINDTLK